MATLIIQRSDSDPDLFLIALTDFHYPGEGQLVERSDLEALIGSGATEILMDQLAAEDAGNGRRAA